MSDSGPNGAAEGPPKLLEDILPRLRPRNGARNGVLRIQMPLAADRSEVEQIVSSTQMQMTAGVIVGS